jgi:AraC-like DNA-binding protein
LLYFRYRISPDPSPPSEPSHPKDKDLSPTYSESEKKRLLQLVQQQELFRNPGLTLSDIAQELSMTSKQVSAIINQGFQMNFNDFINLHRIYAVLDAIQRKEHEEKTLLALAFENGFNSKSTFNRAFKKQTGHTPNYFIKNEVSNLDLKRKW